MRAAFRVAMSRAAGGRALPHHRARAAALSQLRRPRLPATPSGRALSPLPDEEASIDAVLRASRTARSTSSWARTAPLQGRALQEPRPAGRRRRAALRRHPQGAHQAAAPQRRRAHARRRPSRARCRWPWRPARHVAHHHRRPWTAARSAPSSRARRPGGARGRERELSRGGQVFYVYNRVEGLYERAARSRARPDARIAVATGRWARRARADHARLRRGPLRRALRHGHHRERLDIPAPTPSSSIARTCSGSQLYQLRGRVGRSARARLLLPLGAAAQRHDRRGARPHRGARAPHRARGRLPDRLPRPRAARRRRPARRRAERLRGQRGLRALLPDARRGRLTSCAARPWCTRSTPSSASTSRPCCPRTTWPTWACGSRSTSASRAPSDEQEVQEIAVEMEDRFGPPPGRRRSWSS
jgi:hypothetical protein